VVRYTAVVCIVVPKNSTSECWAT